MLKQFALWSIQFPGFNVVRDRQANGTREKESRPDLFPVSSDKPFEMPVKGV